MRVRSGGTGGRRLGHRGGVRRRRDGRDRFAAVVNYIGRGATVELRDWQVERIG